MKSTPRHIEIKLLEFSYKKKISKATRVGGDMLCTEEDENIFMLKTLQMGRQQSNNIFKGPKAKKKKKLLTQNSIPCKIIHQREETWPELRIYKDSWTEANGLADWSGFWKEKATRIGKEDVWGGGIWMDIHEWA